MAGSHSISRIVGMGCMQLHRVLGLDARDERPGPLRRQGLTPAPAVAAFGVLGCACSALAASQPAAGQPSQAGSSVAGLLLVTCIVFAGVCVALLWQLGRARRAAAAASAGASEVTRRLSDELKTTYARLASLRELSSLPAADAPPVMSDLGNRLPRLLEAALPGCDAGLCREGEKPPQGVSVAIQPIDCECELAGSAWVRRRDGQVPEPRERETLAELVRAFVGACDALRHDQRRERLIGTLRDLESQSRRLFESVPVPMWVYSTDSLAILRVNQAAVERYGFSRAEWARMTLEDIRPPEDIPKMRRIIAEVRESNVDSHRTSRHRTKSGEILWVELASRPAPFISPDARLVVCQDVTSREMDLRSLARRTTELSKTNEELDRFATVASHDLQEPLRMIVSFARVLSQRLNSKIDPQDLTYLGYIADGGARMQRLVSSLLDYSRAGSRAVRVAPVAASRALRLAMANLRFELEEAKAVVISEDLPYVAADETLLVMVFQNLISNAIKHRGEAVPVIKVEAEPGEAWCFRVTDNGVGIPADQRQAVFELFRRGDPRPDVPKGTGVGLSICQRVVSRLGGRIWLETPASGRGLSACFTLPAVDSVAAGLANDEELREVKPHDVGIGIRVHTPSERST